MKNKYIRCNSCSKVQEYNEDITSCSECGSDNISVIKSPIDLVNETEILVTESEIDFLLDYNENQNHDKKGNSCWFDISLIKYFNDNTQIRFIVLQNQKSREEDILIDYAGDYKGGNPIVINDTGSIKTILNDIDKLTEVTKVRFLSKDSTKRKDFSEYLNSEEYVSYNKDKYNFYNDAKLRTLVKVLESMGNDIFSNSKEDIIYNKIFTENNVLNSPLFTNKEVLKYNETDIYKFYGDYEFDNKLNDIIYEYQLENELDVFNYLYNKIKNSKPVFTEDKSEEVYYTVTPSMILDKNFSIKPDQGRINPNLLSLLYFKILEKKLGIKSIELISYVEPSKNRIKLFPVSYNGQGYVLADFSIDSPIIFGNMEDINRYSADKFGFDENVKDNGEFKFSVKEIPASFDFQKAISSDIEIIERFFMEFNENTLNETILESESILNEAVSDNKKKRQEIQNKILDVISSLDKDQSNMRNYKSFYDEMNDEEFMRYIKRFINSDENFYIEVLPNKSEADINQIQEALDKLEVPMNEFVYYRHDGNKEDPLRTRYKVPVGLTYV